MGIFSFKNNIVYFPCCTAYFKFKEDFELYKEIFSKLGVSFMILDKQNCCGLEALEAGYDSDARMLARKNFDTFKEKGITGIITSSPDCYKMFLQNYPEILPDWNIRVINLWGLILEKLKQKSHLIKNKSTEQIAYNDNCYLGRYCGIYEEPREILKILGYEIKELDNSRENSFCCGSCGGLPRTNPELADKIAKEKLLQAKRIGVKKMAVIGFDSYELLKRNSQEGLEIVEFSEVLGNALGIKIRHKEHKKTPETKKLIHDKEENDEEILLEN
ncbi:MAG: (Fe-S)-binding protein [Nanoarchaeota archaeon]